MGIAWPLVRARLAAALPAVVGPDVVVYDGPVVTGDVPSAWLSIAHSPSSDYAADGSAGTWAQQVGPDGWSATESGDVIAELASVTGESTIPDVWSTAALIVSWVQSDMTLGGVLSPGSTCVVSARVAQEQTDSGGMARLALSFDYFTRL